MNLDVQDVVVKCLRPKRWPPKPDGTTSCALLARFVIGWWIIQITLITRYGTIFGNFLHYFVSFLFKNKRSALARTPFSGRALISKHKQSKIIFQSDVFCKSCFCQHFDNHSYHLNETKAIQGQEGEYETCPKCGGIVYEAEKVVSRNSLYHRSCLACQQCAKKLSPSNFFDASDGHVYCRQCYSVK